MICKKFISIKKHKVDSNFMFFIMYKFSNIFYKNIICFVIYYNFLYSPITFPSIVHSFKIIGSI